MMEKQEKSLLERTRLGVYGAVTATTVAVMSFMPNAAEAKQKQAPEKMGFFQSLAIQNDQNKPVGYVYQGGPKGQLVQQRPVQARVDMPPASVQRQERQERQQHAQNVKQRLQQQPLSALERTVLLARKINYVDGKVTPGFGGHNILTTDGKRFVFDPKQKVPTPADRYNENGQLRNIQGCVVDHVNPKKKHNYEGFTGFMGQIVKGGLSMMTGVPFARTGFTTLEQYGKCNTPRLNQGLDHYVRSGAIVVDAAFDGISYFGARAVGDAIKHRGEIKAQTTYNNSVTTARADFLRHQQLQDVTPQVAIQQYQATVYAGRITANAQYATWSNWANWGAWGTRVVANQVRTPVKAAVVNEYNKNHSVLTPHNKKEKRYGKQTRQDRVMGPGHHPTRTGHMNRPITRYDHVPN